MTGELMVIGMRGLVAGAALALFCLGLYGVRFSKYYARHARRVQLPCKGVILALRRIVVYMLFALAYLAIFYVVRLLFAEPRQPVRPVAIQWMEWVSYPVLFVALLLPLSSLFSVIRRADEIRDEMLEQSQSGEREESIDREEAN